MLDFLFLRIVLAGLIGAVPGGGGHAVPVPPAESAALAAMDFGDDAATWANDGECDDKRFTGPGMTGTVLLEADIGHDAADCRAAWEAGTLTWFEPQIGDLFLDGVNFGDDSGDWVNDQQCDDPRFAGDGMASLTQDSDRGRDASDCAAAWRAGTITLRDQPDAGADAGAGAPITSPWIEDGVDFGIDSSTWANDGECDDPRFKGEGMTSTILLDSDIGADASDCLAGWRAGILTLSDSGDDGPAPRDRPDPTGAAGKIANRPGQR